MPNSLRKDATPAPQKTVMSIVKITMLHNEVLAALINELQPINFKVIADLQPDEKLLRKHHLVITIEHILKTAKDKNWALCMNDGQLFIYNGEYWHQISKQDLMSFLGCAAEKLGIDKYETRWFPFRAELYKQFMSTAYLPRCHRQSEEILINLLNGTFVITPNTQSRKNFDERDFLTYQLPFNFDESADAPLFFDYLNKVLPDPDQQKVLSEYAGYVFIKQKTLKLEKTLILYGDGANGKSVFFEILIALLGNENVSNYSLKSLTNDSGYHRAKLGTKLLNYASEISAKMDVTFFKLLVSGEPIDARLPYKEPFILKDYAKLIFNTNGLPQDVENNEAFFRRFLIIHFGVTLPEKDRNPELASNIIRDELAGVFNWVLDGLKRLLVQKRFTQSDAVDAMLSSYRKSSDSFQLFIDEEGYEPNPQKDVTLKTIYIQYKQYCSDFGARPFTMGVFTDRLRKAGFDTHRRNYGTIIFAGKKSF